MLDPDGIVRVRPPDNRYDDRGTTRDVLTVRWLHLKELRAEVLRMVTQMQTEMDASRCSSKPVPTVKPRMQR